MTIAELEERLIALEETVGHLIAHLAKASDADHPPASVDPTGQPRYVRESGRFRDDPIFDEAVRLGREYRESLPILEDEGDETDLETP